MPVITRMRREQAAAQVSISGYSQTRASGRPASLFQCGPTGMRSRSAADTA